MTLFDRYLLRQFLFSYCASFLSLLAMYMVIDVFTKFEEFTAPDAARVALKKERHATESTRETSRTTIKSIPLFEQLKVFARNVTVYYMYRIPVFFQRINGIVLLLAAAFTLGWMDRNNELMPILSAGIPLGRLLVPIGGITVLLLVVGVLNTELLIPRCAEHLLRQAEDPLGKRPLQVPGTFDWRRIHVEARVAYPQQKMIQFARVTLPADIFGSSMHITSQEMFYRPGNSPEEHGWIMNGCNPALLPVNLPYLHNIQPGQIFLQTDLTYERLTRRPNWFLYQPTLQLLDVVENETGTSQRSAIIVHVHQRLLAPVLDLLLLMLGLPLIASRSEWNIYIKVGGCLLIFAAMQGLGIAGTMLSKSELLEASFAAWFPLLLLGPMVPPMLMSMRT
jgi:lipopolysaccharide export system permease protein